MKQILSFDEVFHLWMTEELKPSGKRDVLKFVQKQKGFSSITEWRLATALKLGLDKKQWELVKIKKTNKILPNVIIGPYQGWSKFFDNKITTTFANALKIPEFLEWCETHDRLKGMIKNFPKNSTIILFQKPNGEYIHIEGGHRICALALQIAMGEPIKFNKDEYMHAVIAQISTSEIAKLKQFLKSGTNNKY